MITLALLAVTLAALAIVADVVKGWRRRKEFEMRVGPGDVVLIRERRDEPYLAHFIVTTVSRTGRAVAVQRLDESQAKRFVQAADIVEIVKTGAEAVAEVEKKNREDEDQRRQEEEK